MKLSGRTILYACTNHAWRYGWTFYQMLAEAFAAENEVVYVDAPVTLGADPPLAAAHTTASTSLRVLSTRGIPLQRAEWLRQAAARVTASLVARWAAKAGFRPDLVWTYTPYELRMADRFPGAQLVYWTGDEVVIPGEQALLERADLILCVSDPVYVRHVARYPAKTHFVPVACDFERYHAAIGTAASVTELRDLRRPIAGFSGWVNRRLDLDLVIELARRFDGAVALAGPLQDIGNDDVARLRSAGVLVLGPQPTELVPSIIDAFDVALLPLRETEFNRNSNPAKFYEYLALGKPVVATDIPTLRRFGSVASVGPRETFVDRVVAAARKGLPSDVEARVVTARDHSFGRLLERLREVPA